MAKTLVRFLLPMLMAWLPESQPSHAAVFTPRETVQAPQLTIAGQILGPDGPLARAKLELFPFLPPYEQGRSALHRTLDRPATAGALSRDNGNFRLMAPGSGMWRLIAQAPGFVPLEYPLAPLTDDLDVPPVELPRDAGLETQVLDEHGRPVAGARILLRTVRPRDAYSPWKPAWEPARQLATTDAQGRASLAVASGGSLRFEVWAPGFRAVAFSGPRQPRVTVRLARGVERRIEVRDSRLRPARDVLAWIDDLEMPVAAADERGGVAVTLRPGERAHLRLLAAGGESLASDVAAPREARPRRLRLTLRPAAALAGRVIEEVRREAVAGAFVWLARDFSSAVRTDRAGGYLLPLGLVAQGPIRAAAAGYFEETITLPETATGSSQGPTFALRLKAFLEGIVVDAAGKPVPGVEIRTRYDPAAPRRAPIIPLRLRLSGGLAHSRDSGRFRIDDLVPGAAYSLRFAKPGFALHVLQAAAPEERSSADPLRVVLTSGKTAFGFVRDEKEKPVVGASAELRLSPGRDFASKLQRLRDPDPALTFRARSDGSGRFEVRNLGPGQFELAVRASGFAEARVSGIAIPAERDRVDLGTVLLQPEALVSGRVQSAAGQPLAGAAVRIVPADPLEELTSGEGVDAPPDAISDAGGWFQISGRRAGDALKLAVERAGYAAVEIAGVPVPTPEPLVVVLKPASHLAGRVIDADQHSLAGISLKALSQKPVVIGGMVTSGGRSFQTRTRDDGSFAFSDVEPGKVELTASGKGWQTAKLDLQVPAGQDVENVEVVLRQGASVAGRVLAPDGTPVLGAEIGRYEPEIPGTVILRAPLATTDGEGHYQIEGLAPGPLSLVASHGAFGRLVRELHAEPDENALDFQFKEGRTLAGHTIDGTGAPISGARIWLRSSSLTTPSPQVLSRPDGSFAFEGLSPGAYQLQAAKDGQGQTRKPVPVQIAEAPVQDVVLELAPNGVIRGRILGLAPDELAHVQLSVGWRPAEAAVSYDGSFSISDVAPGSWRVVAQLPRTGRQAEGEVAVDPDAGEGYLELDFRQGLRLSGTVRRNGRPFAGASLTLQGFAVSPAWSETDLQGQFDFQGLSEGRYRLEVSDYPTGLVHSRAIELQHDEQILIDLDTAALTGVVIDARNHEPVAGAELILFLPASGPSGPVQQRAVSGTDGGFTFPEVAAGSWRLLAQKNGYGPKEQEVVLDAGPGARHLQIDIEPQQLGL